MNALIGAPNSRNKMPTSMQEKARLARLAHKKVQKLMWMKPAVLVSSLIGIGVAPLIKMISAPYSRKHQAAGGKAQVSPRQPRTPGPTLSSSKKPNPEPIHPPADHGQIPANARR